MLKRTPPTMVDELREEIVARVHDGHSVAEIDRHVIQPAPIDDDDKAGLWLLAWSTARRGGIAP